MEMPGNGGGEGVSAQERRQVLLARIASVIGCPVESFQAGSEPDGATGQAAELLGYWLAIGPEDRRKVMDLARALAPPTEAL